MSKPSLKEKIVIFLKGKYPNYIHSGDLERFGQSQGQKGETTGRRCRELVNEGFIERREVKGSVVYRWKAPQEMPVAMKPRLPSTPKLW